MATEYLTVTHLSRTDISRIFSKIYIDPNISFKETPCWHWQGTGDKYGTLSLEGRMEGIHRVIYAWVYGPIPRGKLNGQIDHLCRNTRCANPAHLEFVSLRINVLRGIGPTAINAVKETCNLGHSFTFRKNGQRICLICKRTKDRERHYARMSDPELAEQERARKRTPHALALQRERLHKNPEANRQRCKERYQRMKADPVLHEREKLRNRLRQAKKRLR